MFSIFKKKKEDSNYRVIYSASTEKLVAVVELAMEQGWRCQGGICRVQTKTGGNTHDYKIIESWQQAMVK